MSEAPFTWPPAEPKADDVAPVVTEAKAPTRRSSLWHELSEMWLAPEAPRLAQRMSDAAWAPDALGDWCDRCGETVGRYEENEFGCSQCRGSRPGWARVVRLGEHGGTLRDWIHEVKFARYRALGIELGRELAKQLRRAGLPEQNVVICPAPTTWRRRVSRGIDHSGTIALGVSQELRAPVERLLAKKHTPSQQTLVESERRRNVSGAFRRLGKSSPGGRLVVLVDDVKTTGATARAACRALSGGLSTDERPSGVWLAVLGVAPRPGAKEKDATQTAENAGVASEPEKSRNGDPSGG